ncbi:MAG: serine/threonine-protein kinase, partial [Chloroflexota bacterium]
MQEPAVSPDPTDTNRPPQAASRSPNVTDALVGRTFGSYTILRRLGAGASGTVYLADDPGMFRQVALKMFPLHLNEDDPSLFGRIQREVQIISRLEHVHILPVYDWGNSDGYAYLSMRLADGSLADALKMGRLSLVEVARLLEQVASALDYAHDQQVIHRDLKPANILLGAQQNCLLADFGIAHLTDGSTSFTPEGRVVGTPLYMSPEQISGQPISAQSDLYSLGVIAFEMVCGQPPFRGATVEVLAQHMNAMPPIPHTLRPDLPQAVSEMILKALAKEPSARFQSGQAFAEAFKAAIGNLHASSSVSASVSLGTETLETTTLPFVASKVKSTSAPTIPKRSARRLILIAGIVLLVVLLIAAVVPGLINRQNTEAAQRYNGQGLQALQQVDYQSAIDDFGAAIHADPALAEAYFNLGVAYEERADPAQNDLDAAISAYRSALKQDDQLLSARYRLAEMLLDQNQNSEAFGIIDVAVRQLASGTLKLDIATYDTLAFELYTSRGRAYWQLGGSGNLDLALNDLKAALALDNPTLNTAEAYYVQAHVYELQGHPDDAKQAWYNVIANSDTQNARQRQWNN